MLTLINSTDEGKGGGERRTTRQHHQEADVWSRGPGAALINDNIALYVYVRKPCTFSI